MLTFRAEAPLLYLNCNHLFMVPIQKPVFVLISLLMKIVANYCLYLNSANILVFVFFFFTVKAFNHLKI